MNTHDRSYITTERTVNGIASYDNKHVSGKVLRVIKYLLDRKIDASEKGAAGGVAALDANGKVPAAQLPSGALGAQIFANTKEAWDSQSAEVPDENAILVYTDKAMKTVDGQTQYIPGIKIGDGVSLPKNLPFVDAATIDGVDIESIVAKQVAHKLTFGNGGVYEFDGSADVTVPVYTGAYNTPEVVDVGMGGDEDEDFDDD